MNQYESWTLSITIALIIALLLNMVQSSRLKTLEESLNHQQQFNDSQIKVNEAQIEFNKTLLEKYEIRDK